jgi:3'-5' exoribonuclease
MKDHFVAQLEPEQTITSFFLVRAKETRTGHKSGKPYLQIELGDRSGSMDARLFQNVEALADTFHADGVVKVKGRLEYYNGRRQFVIDQIRPARDGEYEISDFLPHTAADIDELYSKLREFVGGVGNPWLKQLLAAVIEDPEIVPRLKRAPAGKSMHHACIGGLLEHIVSLCGLCRLIAPHYPEVDADLLLTGAVLHDIGKVEELTYQRAFGYTNEGLLVGHIVSGTEIVGRKMDAIEGFPPSLKTLVKHIILSHHGEYQFGSPVLPKFPEAVLFHYLDQIDSKLSAMKETLASADGEAEWSARNAALGRPLLRLERFRKDELEKGEPPAAADSAKAT